MQNRDGAQNAGGCSSTTCELMAVLGLLVARLEFSEGAQGTAINITMSSAGDNLGCGAILAKCYTSAEPGASLVREIARRSALHNVSMHGVWLPRTQNIWAGILSKGYDGGPAERERQALFSCSKRVRIPAEVWNTVARDVGLMGFASAAADR